MLWIQSSKSMLKRTNILRMALYVAILHYLRDLFHRLPFSVRKSIAKIILSAPLRLSRLILNLATRPIGDEEKWIHKIEQNTWKGVWIVPNLNTLKQAEDAPFNHDLVVLYAHGGGYCKGNATMYMETYQLMINHLQNEHNIRASILSLEYGLSPENVWPKPRDEALEAYRYLTDTIGIPSSKIIFAGDSAGGNLAATMLLTIKSQKNLSLPAGAALLSPWVDLSLNQLSFAPGFATYSNDFLDPTQAETYMSYYIPNYSNLDVGSKLSMERNPLISPLYGDFSGICPIFLAYGENELLRASIEHFEMKLEKDGATVTTLKGKDAGHTWLVNSLVASSKQIYEKDCKTFIDWMASTVNQLKHKLNVLQQ